MIKNSEKYHKSVTSILYLLVQNGVNYEVYEHEPVRTSEEAARVRNDFSLKQGTKALIIRVKKSTSEKFFVMLVITGDSKFDKAKVKKLLNTSDIRFATEDEVREITDGVEPGGVPPFGNIFNMEVYADEGVFHNNIVIFNAGDKRVSIAITSNDYKNLVKPIITQLC